MSSDSINATAPHLINRTDITEKIDYVISALEEIILTFKRQGSPKHKKLIREILVRNRLLGGLPSRKTARPHELKMEALSQIEEYARRGVEV